MWQPIVVSLVVIVAAAYVVRTMGPRRWRRKARGPGAGAGDCGCGKGQGSCR
jgi:hypothetical protein